MFAPPQVIETKISARLPDKFRREVSDDGH